jgi:hypothetical protein
MFRLHETEVENLKSQFATSSLRKDGRAINLRLQFATSSWGGRRYQPHVFTELGVAMLSSVLRSDRAVQMNIYIMRAFVKLRELLATLKDLAEKIQILDKELREQGKDITAISIAVSKLIEDHRLEKRKLPSAIGFRVG